jgi:hypothetical protein
MKHYTYLIVYSINKCNSKRKTQDAPEEICQLIRLKNSGSEVFNMWSFVLGVALFSLIIYFSIKDYKMRKHLKKHPYLSNIRHRGHQFTYEEKIEIEKQKSYRGFGSGPM